MLAERARQHRMVCVLIVVLLAAIWYPPAVMAHEESASRTIFTVQEAAETSGSSAIEAAVAWVVLVILVITLVYSLNRVWTFREVWPRAAPAGHLGRNWWLLVLLGLGLFIAGYLTYQHLTDGEVACGPLGGCKTVQDSEYSELMGLPVALWGVIGYLLMLICWAGGVFSNLSSSKRMVGLARFARPGLLSLSLIAVAFSTYLTSLEVFIIKATCTWCIGSALVAAGLAWIITRDSAWLPTVAVARPRRKRKARR